MFRFPLAVFCLATILVFPAAAGAAEEAPRVKITPIKGPLYELQGSGGNVVASVGDDGVLLIDSDYAEYAPAYEAALAGLSSVPGAPRFLFNTHWHFDHVGGNAYWGEQGTLIAAHDNVYQRMSTRQEMKVFNRVVEPSPAAALPVITYADEVAVHFNGDLVRARHYPHGHTDGDSIIFFTGQNVVHMGDHVFKGAFPFIDIGSGGNAFSFIDNLRAVHGQVNDETVLVPGHGAGFLDRAGLAAYIEVLATTAEYTRAQLAAGKSVEEIAAQDWWEQYASYGQGFIDTASWVSFIAGSL
ncbi:MBL fold metallo-hydrolase [Mangrovimicrobium sediminis]|uniref:MBL fold metallo-hydrolase n=1 Tax=Mangrovimicrobium sediminis TaxID=2562682 RepID=UPI001436B010|nr:MBL fold metallo-hydrolase [Haliea sp. SAOS-164]